MPSLQIEEDKSSTELFAVVFASEPNDSVEADAVKMSIQQLSRLTKRGEYWTDWVRFMAMQYGGPPALMRIAQTRRTKETPETLVNYIYVCRQDQIEENNTFSQLESKYGEKAKLIAKLDSKKLPQ